MIIDNCYVVMPEDAEEVRLMNEVILKHREEKIHTELVEKHTQNISFAISHSITELGLAETKTIVRTLERELRNFKADE